MILKIDSTEPFNIPASIVFLKHITASWGRKQLYQHALCSGWYPAVRIAVSALQLRLPISAPALCGLPCTIR